MLDGYACLGKHRFSQMKKITVATVSLNQFALDFDGNLKRSLESFKIAKEKHACYRLGPELELSGYGCNDHFFEKETEVLCWESLGILLRSEDCREIIGDVGMPVIFNGAR